MDLNKENFFAGSIQRIDGCEVYVPNKISRNFIFKDNKIYKLLEDTLISLTRLDELCSHIPFANIFTNMHLNLEALSSSEIEGTRAEIKELLDVALKETQEKNKNEIQEILNLYKTTYKYYHKDLFDKYSILTLEKMNRDLFNKIEPQNKYSGKIREFQNYIGGDNILNAKFVPPPSKMVKDLLIDLNNFWGDDGYYIPNLIKIAIFHFQFETIHPFMDGNGRMGRLLINLQLKESGLLKLPILCISNYWKRNVGLYYDALSTVRFSHDIEYWIRFFLSSVNSACVERINTIQKINEIAVGCFEKINENFYNTDNYKRFLNYLIEINPYVTVKDAQKFLNLTYQGANKIIDNFVKLGILKEISLNKRNREFIFEKYHDLVFKLIEKE